MVLPASVLLLLSLFLRLLSALLVPHGFFSFLPPKPLQFVSSLTSAFEGRVGSVLSEPEISAGVVADAILLDPHVPVQGHVCTYISCMVLQRSWKRWGTNPGEISRKASGKSSAWLGFSAEKMQMLAFLRLMRWLKEGRL